MDTITEEDLTFQPSSPSSVLILKHLRKLEDGEELAQFWTATWGTSEQGVNSDEVIQSFTVRRDDAPPQRLPDSVCNIPENCLVFRGVGTRMSSLRNLSQGYALVRQEYVTASELINEFYKRPREILYRHFFTTQATDALPQTYSSIFSMGDPGSSEGRAGGVSVVGQTGTGKSLFLDYMLLSRLLSRRTTIWVDETSCIFLFNGEGVFQIDEPNNALCRELSRHLASSAWCLVDSSPSFPDVPDYLLHLGLFILQASCSHSSPDWLMRTNRISTKYYMKPWHIDELIATRDFHVGSTARLSETDIATKFDVYGPIPQTVFNETSISRFHQASSDCATLLRPEGSLMDCVIRLKQGDFRYADCQNMLVLQPASRRDLPHVAVQTRYGANVLAYKGLQTSETLVDDLHAPAEFVLESIIRKYLTPGGTFPLGCLAALADEAGRDLPATSWTFRPPPVEHFCANPNAWLRVGYRSETPIHITKDRDVVATSAMASPLDPITPGPLTPGLKFSPSSPIARAPSASHTPAQANRTAAYYRWLAHPCEIPSPDPDDEEVPPTPVSAHFSNSYHEPVGELTRTGFIIPRTLYAPPYDFLAFNVEDKSAILLQAFYASDQRVFTVSTLGVRWLQSKGVQKISYIACLLGPRPNVPVQLRTISDPLDPSWLDMTNVEMFVSLHNKYGKPWVTV